MDVSGSLAQVKQMSQTAVKFGQAQNASKQQNLRHIEAAQVKQDNASAGVVEQAVENRADAAALKGRIIDTMV